MNRRALMIAFHWTTALLVTASFVIAWLREPMEDLTQRALWLDVHRAIGFTVLALTLARLALRSREGPISTRAELPLGMWLASRASHFLLYAGLIAMPLLGWAQSSAKARHFHLFGLPVPALVRHDPDLAEQLGNWHANLAWALLALIGLHAIAALYHHYVRRDDVVRAMVPRRPSRRRAEAQLGVAAEPWDIAA
jgi:cytochrome b561